MERTKGSSWEPRVAPRPVRGAACPSLSAVFLICPQGKGYALLEFLKVSPKPEWNKLKGGPGGLESSRAKFLLALPSPQQTE